ncbi:helix-turn-helix domain-containing protein [Pseudobacter ginsenosidimutans]|uniref:AraC family transcriptional regulator n=1 Tax=Pseudobacter ginsenosidimutans TaxID=661488 RepID=A0A4Q7N698_9BACT|nr:AraC family transcriptional regulator [Pseudobacter ginsenosidimutans]QEC45046.1 helix-turn-helix domain-containing protein [Pseudobacter ginsenosidimutans]RZS76540.1 AraC family transcriptional regulator [Pseudobacter ginsenosidimutans]
MSTRSKPKLIRNPTDFQQQYLSVPGQSGCELSNNSRTHNFFEAVPLEKLKMLHKDKSFTTTRRNFYTLVLVTRGSIRETIGYRNYEFGANTLYFIPENQLHTIEHWSNDVKGYHCIFDADYFLLCLRNQVKLNHYPFFQPDRDPFMKITETEVGSILSLFEKMHFEYCKKKNHNDDLLVRMYLNILLIEIERLYQHKQAAGDNNVPKRQQMVAQFRKLVAQHYLQKRQVADYAALLYVTPHYLNDTVKEITGKSASEFIYEELVREAKSHLIQTENTVTQIATELNFSDQSYFCRFFKKHTGLSPQEFRKRHFH